MGERAGERAAQTLSVFWRTSKMSLNASKYTLLCGATRLKKEQVAYTGTMKMMRTMKRGYTGSV